MRILWLILLVLLPSLAVEVAQPALELTAILHAGADRFAIVTSPNQSYIITPGDKLGDYRVASIGADTVVFKYQQQAFEFKLAGRVAQGAPFSYCFTKCDLVYALKILARASRKNVFIAPEVTGQVTLTAQDATLEGAVQRVLAGRYVYRLQDGTFTIGSAGSLALPLPDAPGLDVLKSRKVSLDFVNAELKFVIMVLAEEMGLKTSVPPDLPGSVTVTVKSVPSGWALLRILQLQPRRFACQVTNGTLTVRSR